MNRIAGLNDNDMFFGCPRFNLCFSSPGASDDAVIIRSNWMIRFRYL